MVAVITTNCTYYIISIVDKLIISSGSYYYLFYILISIVNYKLIINYCIININNNLRPQDKVITNQFEWQYSG